MQEHGVGADLAILILSTSWAGLADVAAEVLLREVREELGRPEEPLLAEVALRVAVEAGGGLALAVVLGELDLAEPTLFGQELRLVLVAELAQLRLVLGGAVLLQQALLSPRTMLAT